MDHLSDDEKARFLSERTEWVLDGETISRTFTFAGFTEAMGFVTKVAMAAEVADHHPDIDIRWNTVTLALTTHSEGALTAKDTALAARADELAA